LRILVCGGSVAGTALTYFLSQSLSRYPQLHLSLVVLERSPAFRLAGQNVDVQEAALAIVRQYPGLEAKIRNFATKSRGIKIVDDKNTVWGQFERELAKTPDVGDARKDKGDAVDTEEIEVPRGLLAQVFYDETRNLDTVDYRFGDYVVACTDQKGGQVEVTLKSGTKEVYDLVVAADGLTSKTRSIAFPPSTEYDPIKPLGMYCAYFSMPHSEELDGRWARLFGAKGGKSVLLEPDGKGKTRSAFIMKPVDDQALREELDSAFKAGIEAQKALVCRIFSEDIWEWPRLRKAMMETDDFYLSRLAQVKMRKWSNESSNVVLLGDAASCPSPATGMGAVNAITASRVLAEQLVSHHTDLPFALKEYERVYRPYAEKVQYMFPGQTALFCPMSEWTIYAVRV
ncbi:FAD/NAD(P)-binding domain-containing protein, partial [Microstroma glucosiphilum]